MTRRPYAGGLIYRRRSLKSLADGALRSSPAQPEQRKRNVHLRVLKLHMNRACTWLPAITMTSFSF